MSRLRYAVTLTIEVPAIDYPQAVERALRLLRPRVRDEARVSAGYVGAYRGSFFVASMRETAPPPADRVNLGKRRRALRRKAPKARKEFVGT